MKRFLLSLTLALCTSIACAATGTAAIGYTGSSTYTDGSALNPADIQFYAATCSFTPTGASAAGACTAANFPNAVGTATSISGTLSVPAKGGKACFQVTARANGVDSAPSAIVAATSCKTFDPLPPSSPTNITVTITLALTISSDSPISVAMAEPVVTKKP